MSTAHKLAHLTYYPRAEFTSTEIYDIEQRIYDDLPQTFLHYVRIDFSDVKDDEGNYLDSWYMEDVRETGTTLCEWCNNTFLDPKGNLRYFEYLIDNYGLTFVFKQKDHAMTLMLTWR